MKPAILAMSATDWEGSRMSRQQLLARLAGRGWPVVYSNGALHLWERHSPRWHEAGWRDAAATADGVRLYRTGRFPFRFERVPVWDRYAADRHGRRMRQQAGAAVQAGVIAYLWHPEFLPYLRGLGYDWLVYHATDINAKMLGFTSEERDLEAELVERADLVIGTSRTIIKHLPGSGRERARLLMSGSDPAFFRGPDQLPCPPDLARVPRPRIGYTGRVNIKVDFALVAAIAAQRPQWHWVFVGGADEATIDRDSVSASAYARCQGCANVHFLGDKAYEELPAYEAHMDVNTLCYRIEPSGWWIGLSPIKLYEYLAVGNPIVGSPLESVQAHRDVVDLVSDQAGWIAAIERALSGGGVGSREQRRAVAADNSWDRRADQLDGMLIEMIAAQPRA